MNEPDFLTAALAHMRSAGVSVELVKRFRRAYSGALRAKGNVYPCPDCFLNRNAAEYMMVEPKPPTSKLLKCAICDYEITVTSPLPHDSRDD